MAGRMDGTRLPTTAEGSSASDKDEKTKLTLAAASLGYIEIQDERGRFYPA